MTLRYVIVLCIVMQFVKSELMLGQKGVCPGRRGKKPVCCKDWTYNRTTNSCKPKCSNGCIDGECIEPNKCYCKPPLELQNNNSCVLKVTCESPCINGICTERNKCTCNEGYTPKDQFTCIPKCEKCINGECVAPDVCLCNKGYTKINDTCKPVCEQCSNGICVAPDDCQCDVGYVKQEGACKPDCKGECVNGECTAPNSCTCHFGYLLDHENPLNCRPHCENGCSNGTCIAPNICKCFEGYDEKYFNGDKICVAKCTSCEHGTCVGPEYCLCDKNYERKDGACKPICTDQCINGDCISPNNCSCHDGYVSNSTRPSHCYKPCPMCYNGECDNGVCICNTGFSLKNNICVEDIPIDPVKENCTKKEGGNSCEVYPVAPEEVSSQAGIVLDKENCTKKEGDSSCEVYPIAPEEVTSQTGLAGFEASLLGGAIIVLILITLVVIVIIHIWRKRRRNEAKEPYADGNVLGSVAYTVGGTLQNRNLEKRNGPNLYSEYYEENEESELDDNKTSDQLLDKNVAMNDDKYQ